MCPSASHSAGRQSHAAPFNSQPAGDHGMLNTSPKGRVSTTFSPPGAWNECRNGKRLYQTTEVQRDKYRGE